MADDMPHLTSHPPVVVLVPMFDEMSVVEKEVETMQLGYSSKGIDRNDDLGSIEYLLLGLSVDPLWLLLPCAKIRQGDAAGMAAPLHIPTDHCGACPRLAPRRS
jgi:hypothetical protein